MENLMYPKNKGKATSKWPQKDFGGPSIPKPGPDQKEPGTMALFLHPAEKPQFNEPGYRTKLYDTL